MGGSRDSDPKRGQGRRRIDNKVKQVTDPPSTGVRIVSAKSGSTQNWLVKGAAAVNSAVSYKVYYVGD